MRGLLPTLLLRVLLLLMLVFLVILSQILSFIYMYGISDLNCWHWFYFIIIECIMLYLSVERVVRLGTHHTMRIHFLFIILAKWT